MKEDLVTLNPRYDTNELFVSIFFNSHYYNNTFAYPILHLTTVALTLIYDINIVSMIINTKTGNNSTPKSQCLVRFIYHTSLSKMFITYFVFSFVVLSFITCEENNFLNTTIITIMLIWKCENMVRCMW